MALHLVTHYDLGLLMPVLGQLGRVLMMMGLQVVLMMFVVALEVVVVVLMVPYHEVMWLTSLMMMMIDCHHHLYLDDHSHVPSAHALLWQQEK